MLNRSSKDMEGLKSELVSRLLSLASDGRHMVAIAGAPASGKSTFSNALSAMLNAQLPGVATVVQMDGFHYDDAVLKARGSLAQKGAPHTFDVGGFRALLERLRANRERDVAAPLFDRDLEISRGSARIISQDVAIILVEGNYLLLNEDPWRDLKSLLDLTVSLEVPLHELETRLVQRWLGHGLGQAEAEERARSNDLANAKRVLAHSFAADIRFSAI